MVGSPFSLLIAALIVFSAFTFVNLTRDLPSVEILPNLLNPPNGLLLQPTRIYDRTGENILFTFAPDDSLRRYIPLSETNPQHLPKFLGDAVIARVDSGFWKHAGYTLAGINDPDAHPTIAQKLVQDLLLFEERLPLDALFVSASWRHRSRPSTDARRSWNGISIR